MLPGPLQLNQSVVESVTLKAYDGLPSAASLNITTTPSFGRNNADKNQWMVKLKVAFKGAEDKIAPYDGEITIAGVFTITPDRPEDGILKLVATHCPMFLYSTAREIVATLTARGPHGMLTLPTVIFNDIQIASPIASAGESSAEGMTKD
jgi:preprotein translocase subunit SecB